MAILTCPNCAVRVQPEDLICFRCGANLPRAEQAEEDLPTPTVSQRYMPGAGDQDAYVRGLQSVTEVLVPENDPVCGVGGPLCQIWAR